jgi:hypothetical protein
MNTQQGHDQAHAADAQRSGTLPRGVGFALSKVDPPSTLYVAVEDRMRVTIVNSLAGIEVDCLLRLMLPDGQIIPMKQAFNPGAARAAQLFEFDLCEGFLLDVSVTTPTAAARRGMCFVDVTLIRGTGATALPLCNLIDAYVTSNGNQGWPVADNYDSVLGEGSLRAVQIANPAAGAEFSTAVPVGARWELVAITAQLVTAVAAANRAPAIQITDGAAHVLANIPFVGTQAASLTQFYSAQEGGPAFQSGNNNLTGLARNCKLLQGWTVGSLTTLIQAADQWQNIWLHVMEWIES